MAILSLGYAIRQAVQTLIVNAPIVDASGLTVFTTANTRLRMLTKATKGIDTFPIIVISPYATIGDKPADFQGGRDRPYRVRVALIDDMEGDSETNDDLYGYYIEQVLNAIVVTNDGFARNSLPGLSNPGVWEINTESVNTFDDGKMLDGCYAFQNLVLRFEYQ